MTCRLRVVASTFGPRAATFLAEPLGEELPALEASVASRGERVVFWRFYWGFDGDFDEFDGDFDEFDSDFRWFDGDFDEFDGDFDDLRVILMNLRVILMNLRVIFDDLRMILGDLMVIDFRWLDGDFNDLMVILGGLRLVLMNLMNSVAVSGLINYPLVNIQTTMENHNCSWENSPFSIAILT